MRLRTIRPSASSAVTLTYTGGPSSPPSSSRPISRTAIEERMGMPALASVIP